MAIKEITLIGTVHGERGRSNTAELMELLERFAPEVIFEEIDRYAYDNVYLNGGTWKLESEAIKEYQNRHTIMHVPVDPKGIPISLVKRFGEIMRRVCFTNRSYCELQDQDLSNRNDIGFDYLNSDKQIELKRKMDEQIEIVVERSSVESWKETIREWMDVERARERGMVDSIYQYCAVEDFQQGVFVFGAAHREGIISEIELRESDPRLKWNYNITEV